MPRRVIVPSSVRDFQDFVEEVLIPEFNYFNSLFNAQEEENRRLRSNIDHLANRLAVVEHLLRQMKK